MLPPVSVRAFAKLDGCSHTLVQRGVKEGKLPTNSNGKIDPALAGTGWRKDNRRGNTGGNVATTVATAPAVATDGNTAPDLPSDDQLKTFVADLLAGRFATIADAERVKENGLALKHMLDGRKKAGELVERSVAERVLFESGRQVRDAWLSWPSNSGPMIAAELGIAPEPLIEALTKYVHRQIADLGEPEPEFAAAG